MRRALGPSAAALRGAAWHEVITARRLVGLGMRETTVYARCRDGGPLPSRLRHDRAVVAAELRSAYAHAAARPRPTVRAVPGA